MSTSDEMKALADRAREYTGETPLDADTFSLIRETWQALESAAALSPLPDEQLDEEGLAREMVSAINYERGTEPGWTLTPRGNERMVRVCARVAMAEIARLRALSSHPDEETEWEYGIIGDGDSAPWSDLSVDLDYLLDEAGSSISSTDRVVRRRKAGPWEPVPEGSET